MLARLKLAVELPRRASQAARLTRLKPAVEDVLHSAQHPLALARGDGQVIDEVAVQVGHLWAGE